MKLTIHRPRAFSASAIGIVFGSTVLAIKPLMWLAATWYSPGYQSVGWLVFVLVAGVFAWCSSSPLIAHDARQTRSALILLVVAATVRLAAQLLAIDLIGALTLAVDVYALGLLAGLHARTRAASPFWIAVLFCFCLPVEPVLQRLLGFALQHLSAAGACGLLQLSRDAVSCSGVRILIAGKDVLVDLPCSGAQLLTHTLLMFALLAALRRPSLAAAAGGLVIAVAAAWLANSLRIAVLATGIAYPEFFGGADLMAEPWHDIVGLCFVALAGAMVAVWASRVTPLLTTPGTTWRMPLPTAWQNRLGITYALTALIIVSVTPRPVDVSGPVQVPELPLVLGSSLGETQPLSSQEQAYFTRFGGSAARASYGPFALLMVSTRSPLRHLHAPDVCLEGSGHRVTYLGSRFEPLPTAVYRSQAPNGSDWRIGVTFVSARGHSAASVSEAIWYWLTDASSAWTMVQRITPWDTHRAAAEVFEAGVIRALNYPPGGVSL
jgi:exosortase/archaeosortase family protein